MAEASTQIQPTQGTPGQAPAAQSTPASTQSQEPAWMTHVPEQFRDEAKKSYLLQSDYTKKTQELADQRKSWESEQEKYKGYESKLSNYDKWWNENSKTIELLQKNWDKVQPILTGQPAPTQDNAQPSHFRDYDILPPEEQAKRVAEYVQNQYVTKALEAQKQEYAATLAEKQSQMQNYLAILTDAFERKSQDPGLNIRDYIQKATEIASGKFNPMEMAYHTLTDPQKLEKQKAEWWAQAKEEGMLEERNKHQSPGAFQGSGVPNFKVKPQSREDIKTAVQKLAMEKGFGWGA
jgi:hypothetical protein